METRGVRGAAAVLGVAIGIAVGGGLSHLLGGTERVVADVVAAEEDDAECETRGAGHWTFEYRWEQAGTVITATDSFCTSSPPRVGEPEELWVDADNEVASHLSPTAARIAAVATPAGLLVVVGAIMAYWRLNSASTRARLRDIVRRGTL